MSTYLVALVVSDFTPVIDEKYKVWARPNAISQGKFALSIMGKLVSYYEDTLKLPYQLPKLDMVALPDFASGAMENWGLLTYKERNVLYDDYESTITVKQSIANVISHEISHQWFGNLVSPLWWKYIWLNEGFARYYQYFGTANVRIDKLLTYQVTYLSNENPKQLSTSNKLKTYMEMLQIHGIIKNKYTLFILIHKMLTFPTYEKVSIQEHSCKDYRFKSHRCFFK